MSEIVAMTKNGETLGVHSTCVEDHQRNGWTVGGDLPSDEPGDTIVEHISKTVAEVLAMADDGTPFMTFKSAAAKVLGDACPAKKDEIVAALMELATKPE
jgi:hypothetical protein